MRMVNIRNLSEEAYLSIKAMAQERKISMNTMYKLILERCAAFPESVELDNKYSAMLKTLTEVMKDTNRRLSNLEEQMEILILSSEKRR